MHTDRTNLNLFKPFPGVRMGNRDRRGRWESRNNERGYKENMAMGAVGFFGIGKGLSGHKEGLLF